MRLISAIVAAAFVALVLAIPVSAQETVTLYSRFKHGNDSRSAFDFESRVRSPRRGSWDIAYGNLRVGEDFDWFETSSSQGRRSVVRDLGEYAWTDAFPIPVVEPLAKLKPGERREIVIDTSGADGKDGATGPDADGVVRPRPQSSAAPQRPKRDGKPKIDPMFVRAVVGHIYVIHVVDDVRDFYALFRVENLQKGDQCTISWKLIAPPLPAKPKSN